MSINSLGVIQNADGKWRKPGQMLRYALDPGKLGGLFEQPTPKVPPPVEAPKTAAAAIYPAGLTTADNIAAEEEKKKKAAALATSMSGNTNRGIFGSGPDFK